MINMLYDCVFSFSKSVLFSFLKGLVGLVLVVYIVIPVFVKTNPWIQSKVIFLNNCKLPFVHLLIKCSNSD